jgi:large subunit ribosomal protein L10
MLLFQHNNLKSSEWVGIRRELSIALRKTSEARVAAGQELEGEGVAEGIRLQIIQTGIFGTALKIVEFYKPNPEQKAARTDPTDPETSGSASMPVFSAHGSELTHTLSKAAHEAISSIKSPHDLDPLLSGPLVLLTFPDVSPAYLKTALSILSPSPPAFPAPTRRANPGWHDPAVQGGVQKLLLLGARVEGKVFDVEGTKWVGGIEGGLEGLRAQLVGMLQSIGGAVTGTLESAGRSLWVTVEGRRGMLEDVEKGEGSKEEQS